MRKLAICHVSPSFFIKLYLEYLWLMTKIFSHIFPENQKSQSWILLISLWNENNSHKKLHASYESCLYLLLCGSFNSHNSYIKFWLSQHIKRLGKLVKVKNECLNLPSSPHCNHNFLKPCINHDWHVCRTFGFLSVGFISTWMILRSLCLFTHHHAGLCLPLTFQHNCQQPTTSHKISLGTMPPPLDNSFQI